MGKTSKIWISAIYLLLLTSDKFVFAKPADDNQSKNHVRPALTACENYKRMAAELPQPAAAAGTTSTKNTADAVSNNFQAKSGEFPYVAAVFFSSENKNEGDLKYSCAGTLVSEKHVITAAHCATFIGRRPVEVTLGAIDLDRTTQGQEVQIIQISRVIAHPQFDRNSTYHDIAILELKEPIRFTIQVQPTCLMTESLRSEIEGANSLVVTGWRNIERDGKSSMKLVKAENQKIMAKNECSEIYNRDSANPAFKKYIPNGLDDGMICVTKSDLNGEPDSCWGTSGAPVLVPSATSGFRTSGFSSWGYMCGTNKPSVAVSVYKYLNWIEDQVWPAAKPV